MANDFSLGGSVPLVIHRQLTASDQWIPTSTVAQYTDWAGNAVSAWSGPPNGSQIDKTAILAEIAGVGANNGFLMGENIPVAVVFNGLSASTVALQEYYPMWTGGAAWKTVIPASEFADGKELVFMSSALPWRVGVVTYATDTLFVTVKYHRQAYGRHA